MARARLLKLQSVVTRLKQETDARGLLVTLNPALSERQQSSAFCTTSYASRQAELGSTSPHAFKQVLRGYRHSATHKLSSTEAYAEFTQLQKLLQQYRRNLGAVGKAVTEFTQHLWRRKNASGLVYGASEKVADSKKNELAATEEELISSIRQSSVGELLEAMAALAELDQRPDENILRAMAESLDSNLERRESGPSEVAQALGRLAALGYQPPHELLDRLSQRVADDLDACSPDDISRLMNSLAAFGRTHFPLMSKVADSVIHRGSEFSSEALADLLYTFASLHYDAQHMVDSILERILFDLKAMSPAALCQLVFGLHLLNHRDAVTDVFLDALAEAALEQLHHFSARQLATLAYNYGTLNHWGRNDQELLDAITIRMLHQYQELTPRELGNLVWSIARASHASPTTNALLSVVSTRAVKIVDTFSPEQLSRLLHSLAQLSFYNQDLFGSAERFVKQRLDDFSAEDLALTACAFARLMHKSDGLMPAVLEHLNGRFEELSAHGLCGLIWGAAVSGELTLPTFEAANDLLDSRTLQEFTARDFVRLFQAELLMQVKLPPGNKQPRLTAWLRSYAERSLRDKLYLDRHTGNTHQEICRCLMQLGITYTLENVVDAVLAVDITLKLRNHPKVAIKVEQVSKYTSSRPQQPLADALVTRRLLQARSWKLICIPEHEWVRLRSFEEKLAFLESRISETVAAPPGLTPL